MILEMTNRATTNSGVPYANKYCFFFELDAGKIRHISEYTDQLKVRDIVGAHDFDELGRKMAPVVEPED